LNLKVCVRNLSDRKVKVSKYRQQDYKRENIRAFGNYVIELEKFENGKYFPFPPSADIDPVSGNQESILLEKGDSIVDTLYIDGHSYSRVTDSKRVFPLGQYRVRIYFNPDIWSSNEENGSNWTEFKIE
jgi:hypothetical protein